MKKDTEKTEGSEEKMISEIEKTIEKSEHDIKSEIKKDIKSNSSSISIIIGSLIIAGSILLGFYMYGSKNTNTAFVDPDSIFSGRELKKEEFLVGNGDKKVVLLEYSDMECPFCKKLHVETMQDVYKNYSNKIDIAFRHYPLPMHKQAPEEAVATLCARDVGGQQGYKNYIEKIYELTNGNDTLDLSTIPKIAGDLGLDVALFEKCINDESSKNSKLKQVSDDLQDGYNVGVDGTPNVFVLIKDGSEYRILTVISGARDYKYVSRVIDQALKQ